MKIWACLMPFKSKAQAAYFNTHRKQLAKQGVNVDEWNQASKGMKLPNRSPKINQQRVNDAEVNDGLQRSMPKRKLKLKKKKAAAPLNVSFMKKNATI